MHWNVCNNKKTDDDSMFLVNEEKGKNSSKESHDCDLYSRRILAIVQPYKFQHRKEDDTKIYYYYKQ